MPDDPTPSDAKPPQAIDDGGLTGDDGGPQIRGLIVFGLSIVIALVLWLLQGQFAEDSTGRTAIDIALMACLGVLISIVIWQACDPFAEAAQWIGTRFHLPGSVRGATLDAVASSMPELFAGIFFVVVAMSAVEQGDTQGLADAGAEGFGSTIATAAGSAVYNMILIPAVVAIVVSMFRKKRPTVEVDDEVLSRDGVCYLVCVVLLIVFLYQKQMHWWMGVTFLAIYVGYVFLLWSDARRYKRRNKAIAALVDASDGSPDPAGIVRTLRGNGHRATLKQVDDWLEKHGPGADGDDDDEDDDVAPNAASVFFGFFNVPIGGVSAWVIIAASTVVAAGACYFLVEITRETAEVLNVPTFFVAVILAAAVSSVPDTFLSVGAAMRGDDSGAVSNAFGSNIFDICICLSIPLLVNSYMLGWGPVEMQQDGKPIPGLVGLPILLAILTTVTLAVMWHNRQLTRFKAIGLCLLYAVFVAYAVAGSLGLNL